MIHATSLTATTITAEGSRVVGAGRTLVVLSALATCRRGISLETITSVVGSPKPTVHRAVSVPHRAAFACKHGQGDDDWRSSPPAHLPHVCMRLDTQAGCAPGDVMRLGIDRQGTRHQTVVGPR